MNFTVNKKKYNNKNVLIIAEIGTAHSGDIVKARELTAAAAEAGADCVKTQIVYADEIIHPLTGLVPLPGGNTPLYEVFKKLERPPEFFAAIKEYTESKGLLFLATPFGPLGAACLKSLSPDAVKIASPELNYTQLLQTVGGWGLPALLSSGVSTLADIETALSFFDKERVCLLHCVTAYPAPETDYNLTLIKTLGAIFGVSAGVSDHSMDACLVPSLAVASGACAVEKHFCISRNDTGLDDPIALPAADFAVMSAAIRRAEKQSPAAVIQELERQHSAKKISLILGNGVKRLAASEAQNYTRTNRSIHALRDIRAGEILSAENCAILRTEKTLRPGMPPFMLEKISGIPARRDIPSGEGVRFEDITLV
ncbi:MAG: N-acetylneuraminate synthase family protein [Spirochaetaceae bacterium]|jgi:sialic acid synthase SpsE|nr:N-acetylneuraminate synthase family protein [Spirochaetaceae bacterium]